MTDPIDESYTPRDRVPRRVGDGTGSEECLNGTPAVRRREAVPIDIYCSFRSISLVVGLAGMLVDRDPRLLRRGWDGLLSDNGYPRRRTT
jgi:hypothetical protein